MPNRKGARNAYYFFVLEKLPELKQRGLAVTGVRDAIPYCSGDWTMLTEEQKEKYAEIARQQKAQKSEVATKKFSQNLFWKGPKSRADLHYTNSPIGYKERFIVEPPSQVLPSLTTFPFTQTEKRLSAAKLIGPPGKSDKVVLETTFFYLNIFSHGVLPSHCKQRFLPCEIGCVKYSLKDGIIAEFHHFVDPGEVPRGFRFHCQAASDATHRIPVTGFELATANHSIVLRELYSFIQPRWGAWPPVYCKSSDLFRVNWCLQHMAREAGTVNNLEILCVEDLVVELYYQKLQKEPSKAWVCNSLDASIWDYSSNTRCKWHEENDVLFCALATCKKIAYCISNSLANMYCVQLTACHLPLCEKDSQNTTNPKMVVLDAARFQRMRAAEHTENERYYQSLDGELGAASCTGQHPSGVKTIGETTTRRGRGIAWFLESISKKPSS